MNLTERYFSVRATIPSAVRIIAVSKYKPLQEIEKLHVETGHIDFGENKVQDLALKAMALKYPIKWHFIGHLQTNKVKALLPHVSMIQSIDSIKLLEIVNKEAQKINRIIPCLLQFYIAKEETKFGFIYEEVAAYISSGKLMQLKNIEFCGVMGMATFSDNKNQIREEFQSLKRIYNSLKRNYFEENDSFKEISMGMSDDFNLAIEEGSTMVRIGSGIFGMR